MEINNLAANSNLRFQMIKNPKAKPFKNIKAEQQIRIEHNYRKQLNHTAHEIDLIA